MKEFIDVDSTYRDRTRFPNPANFMVQNARAQHGAGTYTSSTNPVVEGGISFPIVPTVAFIEDVNGEQIESLYLPYVFSVLGAEPTTLFIGSLPLARTDPTSGNVDLSLDNAGLPTFRPNTYDNAYIGQYIEIITPLGDLETRAITDLLYISTPTPLHSGTIYAINGDTVTFASPPTYAGVSPSDITNFYVGKTIQIGTTSFDITRYTYDSVTGLVGTATVSDSRLLGGIPTGTVFTLYAPESWIITIDRAFSTSIPTYPAYSVPRSSYTFAETFIQNTELITPTDLQYTGLVNDNILLYTAENTPFSERIVFSVRQTAPGEFSAPVQVAIESYFDLYPLYLESGVAPPQRPYVLFNANNGSILYSIATDNTAAVWSAPITIPLVVGSTQFVTYRNIMSFPVVYYTNSTYDIFFTRSNDFTGAVWSVPLDTGVNGYVGAVGLDGNASEQSVVIYQDATDGFIYALKQTETNFPPSPPTFTDPPVLLNNQQTVNWSTGVSRPVLCYQRNTVVLCFVDVLGDVYVQYGLPQVDQSLADPTLIPANTAVRIATGAITSIRRNIGAHVTIFGTGAADFLSIVYVGTGGIVYEVRSADQSGTVFTEPQQVFAQNLIGNIAVVATQSFGVTYNIPSIAVLYDTSTLAVADGVIQSSSVGIKYRIRTGQPLDASNVFTNGIVQATSTSTSITLVGGAATDVYSGKIVRVYTTLQIPNTTTPPVYENLNGYAQITSYDSTSGVATLSSALPFSPSDFPPPYAFAWEILQFSRDSYSPIVSQTVQIGRQNVCANVRILSLVLPNRTLETGVGNRIAFYPYVYVEIEGAEHVRGGYQISTNNPNAKRAVFKVPIYNVNTPDRSQYVVLNGQGMVQTMKISSNYGFHIRIILPNGDIFYVGDDTLPPEEPNPDIQVSLLLEVEYPSHGSGHMQ